MTESIIKHKTPAAVYLKAIAEDLSQRMSKLQGKGGRCSEMIRDAVFDGCKTEWYAAINDALNPRKKDFPYEDVRAAICRLERKGLLSFLEKRSFEEMKAA